jgi:hypothetical protein
MAFSLGRANSERGGVDNNYDRYYDVNNRDNNTNAGYGKLIELCKSKRHCDGYAVGENALSV